MVVRSLLQRTHDEMSSPTFTKTAKGEIAGCAQNIELALRSPACTEYKFSYDTFLNQYIIKTPEGQIRPMKEADYFHVETELNRIGMLRIPTGLVPKAVRAIAEDNAVDAARNWLTNRESGSKWDGIERVKDFMVTYLGAESCPYSTAVSFYIWSALAGRVLLPGAKADMVPVFIGAQGIRKTTLVMAMAPHPDWACTVDISVQEKEIVRLIRGKLIVELGELDGLGRRDQKMVKRFVASTFDDHRRNYSEFTERQDRRCLFIGTTNDGEFLTDGTGNRRWLPIHVTKANVEALQDDLEQLWLEGELLFRANGVMWREAEELAKDKHKDHMIENPMEERVAAWLSEPTWGARKDAARTNGERSDLTPVVIYKGIGIAERDLNDKRITNAVAKAMKALGYESRKNAIRINGQRFSLWVKSDD